jgi:hypothetical protein
MANSNELFDSNAKTYCGLNSKQNTMEQLKLLKVELENLLVN